MKKTILALGIATVAAMAGATGANAFSAPADLKSGDSGITKATWWGYNHDYYYKPYHYGYGHHYGWYGYRHGYGWNHYHHYYPRHHYGWYGHRSY